jgi:hypothetical protein
MRHDSIMTQEKAGDARNTIGLIFLYSGQFIGIGVALNILLTAISFNKNGKFRPFISGAKRVANNFNLFV